MRTIERRIPNIESPVGLTINGKKGSLKWKLKGPDVA